MNKANREEVQKLLGELSDLKSQAETIGSRLQELADDEQGKYDNLSDGLQQSESGQALETAAGSLSDAAQYAEAGDIGEAINSLESME
jgi:hypothetical protein